MINFSNGVVDVDVYRKRVQSYLNLHLYQAALFWADKVVALTVSNSKDVYWLAQCMFHLKQYHRAAHLLKIQNLDKTDILCNNLSVRCMLKANQYNEALKILNLMDVDEFVQNSVRGNMHDFELSVLSHQIQSSVLVLRGQVLEAMDNRGLASECYRNALKCDVFCYEAFENLIQHNMLSASEEEELFDSLPILEQCNKEEAEMVTILYRSKMKKYHTHLDAKPMVMPKVVLSTPQVCGPTFADSPNVTPMESSSAEGVCNKQEKITLDHGGESAPLRRLEESLDFVVSQAEQLYYNCDYQRTLELTEKILRQDPYHSDCLLVHISCLVELKKSNKLFTLAHKLVDLYPELAIAWYAVGCYYYIINKSDLARRYLAKATSLDKLFGPAWLAFGHSFAIENEHDQAMAAYFKASQLMKGCHLPLMYIGLECGLTNNVQLAEKFFQQANSIAPDDPFVIHEMGVIALQNNNFSVAEGHFNKALSILNTRKLTPIPERWAPLHNNLGHALRKQKKYDEALDHHHQALVLNPNNASTYSAIAFVHALTKNLDESADWFHRALGLKRDDTFSSTMLNYVIEHIAEDQIAYPGAPDYIPDYDEPQEAALNADVDQEAESTRDEEEPTQSGSINQTADMSMSLDMDVSDSTALAKD
ncbi:PREDICTED: cell division cycle protein 16 homolog [Nicrophorus vespilloides]|uniref:Cell division cycle protein 16 homolog n=1 Tax=Nicrophorus vespilloides TaxID=110193 RepID=A0ABM1NAH6_NICVS|nr:PREDICTED: cell division cycle protein 16 homolog [Nicrophorus vespilloides]